MTKIDNELLSKLDLSKTDALKTSNRELTKDSMMLSRNKSKPKGLERLAYDIWKAKKSLEPRINLLHQIELDATYYAKKWFILYWLLIFSAVFFLIILSWKNWSNFGEPLFSSLTLLAPLLLAAKIIFYHPNQVFIIKKQYKMKMLMNYWQFDLKKYRIEVQRLEVLEKRLEILTLKNR